jgi:hypothetical protein
MFNGIKKLGKGFSYTFNLGKHIIAVENAKGKATLLVDNMSFRNYSQSDAEAIAAKIKAEEDRKAAANVLYADWDENDTGFAGMPEVSHPHGLHAIAPPKASGTTAA